MLLAFTASSTRVAYGLSKPNQIFSITRKCKGRCEKSASYCPSHTPHGSLCLNTLSLPPSLSVSPLTFPSLLPSSTSSVHHGYVFFLRKGKDQHQKREESPFEALDLQTFGTMAATTTQTEEQVSLKLLVNKDTNKVLFAEAGKDFVDILCSFLTLPLGTITRLVEEESNMEPITVGCLNSLYHSVEDLNPECLKTETCKDMLLQPGNSSEEYCSNLKLNIDDTEPKKYFMCANLADCKYHLLSTFKNQRCECGSLLDRSVLLQSDKKVCNGFVKDASTFIVTDDLIVMPNSMGTSFVQSFGITTTSSVKEITVNFTEKQVLDLLKYSLLSKSTLTNLFWEKDPIFIESKSFPPCDVANNSTIQIKVKLFLRKTDGEILFAQGEEDFADFLFSFLTFPLGGIVRMLGGNSSLGSIDTLYKSIADLDGYKYMMSDEVKNSLVDPCIASQFKITKQMLHINEPRASSYYCYYQRSFRESIIHNQFSVSYGFRGYNILKETYTRLKLVDPKSSKESHDGCYVKGPALFMVTNDLAVEPMSPISAISLLDRLETPPSNLSEKVVFIGVKEGLSLLKAALTSRSSALTNGLGHLLTEFKEEKWYWQMPKGYWFRT